MQAQAATAVKPAVQRATDGASNKRQIPIVPRRVELAYDDYDDPFFVAGNSIVSSMFVALSTGFPAGEKEFIRSVRNYLNEVVDPTLKRAVKDFASQEAQHSHQHTAINETFERLGYPAKKIEAFFEDFLGARAKAWSNAERLANTVVMEHITAVMAHFALTHPETFEAGPDSFRRLMLWHAIEEIEHKSVAFDVYMACVGERGRLLRRLFIQLFMFPYVTRSLMKKSLRHLGHKPSLRERAFAAKFLFGKNGMITSMLGHYLSLAKPGFHPWDVDDSALVELWKEKLDLA